METNNKVRIGGLGSTLELEQARLAFVEVGGGFYICEKDIDGVLGDQLYTADEVKDYFNSDNKVLIQVNVEVKDLMNKYGKHTFIPMSNFDPTYEYESLF